MRVTRVVSDVIIQTKEKWQHLRHSGTMIKIAGLLPADRAFRTEARNALEQLLLGKTVAIKRPLYLSGGVLTAMLEFEGMDVPQHFPQRQLADIPHSRFQYPDDTGVLARVHGGLPSRWKNPVANLPPERTPYLGNLSYPTKPWEKNFAERRALAESLHSDTYHNSDEMRTWLGRFLQQTRPEVPVILEGPVGVGKSWFLARALMNLETDRHHVIYVDLRSTPRGELLRDHLQFEIDEFLRHYLTDHRWLHAKVRSTYGSDFDPQDADLVRRMREIDLAMSMYERNLERIRYYSQPGSPDLIVAFDNIDHYSEDEQEIVVDVCRRLVGSGSGVRAIFAVRPTTLTLKDRLGAFPGDTLLRTLYLRSADVHDILRRRLTTNAQGKRWSAEEKIPGTQLSWTQLLEHYRQSDHDWGTAGLIRALCTTAPIGSLKRPMRMYTLAQTLRQTDYISLFDCRHYLRLFRRLLRSHTLDSIANIRYPYYAIHALTLRNDEPMSEPESFLFNVFDNESPVIAGNALVRYRVLEYFRNIGDPGSTFDLFFDALGCGAESARAVLDKFVRAGLIEYRLRQARDRASPEGAGLTIPGERHFEIITNLWYIICIKTGMSIYSDCILYGSDAIQAAKEFVKRADLLDFFGEHGWVPDEKFFGFIYAQEQLEADRIGRFQEQNPDKASQVAGLMTHLSSPTMMMYYAYHDQLHAWRQRQQINRDREASKKR